MTTVIKGWALIYYPIEETVNSDGYLSWSGDFDPTSTQASDMPDYLQEAVARFLREKYPGCRLGDQEYNVQLHD